MQIVIDDVGDIPPELAQKHNIMIIPINIMFGTEEFLSGVNMDRALFYEKTKQVSASNFPKTSQPTPYQFVEFYKKILATGEKEILVITVSEKLSGTYASAIQAEKELAGQGSFYAFDSMGGTAVQGFMAIEAAKMSQEGKSAPEIFARLKRMRDEMIVVFTIDNLEYAVKGGRVSSVKSLMASLLNIKPILRLNDGLIVQMGQVRTRKKALPHIVDMVVEKVGNKPVKLAILHAGVPQEGAELLQLAQSRLKATEIITVDLAIAIAINLGPGALGIAAIPE